MFDPGQLDTTLDALEAAADSTDDTDQAKTQAARRRVAKCDTRLARYRAALEAGTDPAVVSAWIAEVQAERLVAEVDLGRATVQRSRRMSRDQLAALVNGLGNLLDVLATAAPEDKAEVYRRLGLRLTYDPARRVVIVESRLGPDGSGALPRGARPSGGPTSGAPAADRVGESQCRRGDLSTYDTRDNARLGAPNRAFARTSPCRWLASNDPPAFRYRARVDGAACDIDDEVECLVVAQRDLAAVEIEEHDDRQPCESLVPIDERVITGERVEERGRLQIDRGVHVLAKGACPRSRQRRLEQTHVSNRADPEHPNHAEEVLEVEVLGLPHSRPRRSSTSPQRSASRCVPSATRRRWTMRS